MDDGAWRHTAERLDALEASRDEQAAALTEIVRLLTTETGGTTALQRAWPLPPANGPADESETEDTEP